MQELIKKIWSNDPLFIVRHCIDARPNAGGEKLTGEMANMTVLGLTVGLVILVSIVLMAIVGGSHVFD